MKQVSIIGAGSWGTALAVLLGNNGHEVTIWSHDLHEVEMLRDKREQQEKLPDVKLPDNVNVTSDLEESLTGKDVIVMAVPSPVVRSVAKQMSPFIPDGQVIVNVAKGIEDGTYMTLSAIIEEEIPNAEVCVLSGPSHAEEVGRGIPTTVVVGSKKQDIAEMLQDVFMNQVFRVYTNPDIIGIELGGALKNVIALAAHFPRCSLAVFDSYGPGFGIYRRDMSNSYVALRIGFIFIVNEFKIYIGVFPVAL